MARIVSERLLPGAAAVVVRGLAATLRLTVVGDERLRPLWAAGRPLIYVVWHGQLLLVPWANARLRRTHGARAVRVLASLSRDGELIARFAERFGVGVVRGSSSRGGAAAMRALVAALAAGEDVAVVPDGPRGPRRTVQPGAVALAALSGAPIVPLAFAAQPARRLRTWDEFMIPLPLGRAALVFGEPITVARDDDRDRTGAAVARALESVTARANGVVAA